MSPRLQVYTYPSYIYGFINTYYSLTVAPLGIPVAQLGIPEAPLGIPEGAGSQWWAGSCCASVSLGCEPVLCQCPGTRVRSDCEEGVDEQVWKSRAARPAGPSPLHRTRLRGQGIVFPPCSTAP